MSYRINAIEISTNDPFKHDKLQRASVVDFVAGIVEEAEGEPLVLAIDGPYGSGKSTFVRMLQVVLEDRKYQAVFFDAWKADHVSDPLIALVAELDAAIPHNNANGGLQARISKVKEVAGILGKRAFIAGLKLSTAGLVDIPADLERIMVDGVGDAAKDLIEKFQAETKLVASFRVALEDAVESLVELDKKPVLIFFIDELDRCRPDFAITLLKRVKHMFDVRNVIFVLSVDKAQLEGATAAVYGDRIDTVEYLRKFIDMEFRLPSPSSTQFIDASISLAGMNPLFAARMGVMAGDRQDFVRFFAMLADIFEISLRTQERCILRLKLVLAQTVMQEYLHPAQLALLLVLRMVDPFCFWKVVDGALSPDEIETYIAARGKAKKYIGKNEWISLQAMLIFEDQDERRRAEKIRTLESQIHPRNSSPRRMLSLIANYENLGLAPGQAFDILAKKIDLVSRVT